MFELTEEGRRWLDEFDSKYQHLLVGGVYWERLGVPSHLGIPRREISTFWLLDDISKFGFPTGRMSDSKMKKLSSLIRLGLIEEVETPKRFFHVTLKRNLPSILERGLEPEAFRSGLSKKTPSKYLRGKGTPGIYLEPGVEEAPTVGYYGRLLEEGEGEPVILEVELPPDILTERDPGEPGALKVLETIPPEYIKVLDVTPEELR